VNFVFYLLIHMKTPQCMFVSLSHLSAKKCGYFLSYYVNQLGLCVSGKYIIVAKIALVSMKN